MSFGLLIAGLWVLWLILDALSWMWEPHSPYRGPSVWLSHQQRRGRK